MIYPRKRYFLLTAKIPGLDKMLTLFWVEEGGLVTNLKTLNDALDLPESVAYFKDLENIGFIPENSPKAEVLSYREVEYNEYRATQILYSQQFKKEHE